MPTHKCCLFVSLVVILEQDGTVEWKEEAGAGRCKLSKARARWCKRSEAGSWMEDGRSKTVIVYTYLVEKQ